MPICAIQHRSATGRFLPIQKKILSRRGPCFDKHNFVVQWIEWQVKHLRKNLYTKFKHADKVYIDGDNVQILFKPHEMASEKLNSDNVTESGHNDHVTNLEIEGSKKDSCYLVNEESLLIDTRQTNELNRDLCGHAHSRHTSSSNIVPCERVECKSLSKCVCGSGPVSTSCSHKKLTRKKRHKNKHHLTMLKKNVCKMNEDCYHGVYNIDTSVVCSAQQKKQYLTTNDFNNSLLRFLHDTTLLCVQLILLLLVLVFAEMSEFIYYPVMNVRSEIPFNLPRRATVVEVEVFKWSVSEVNSFLQYGGGCNGLVMMLLLLLSGDVEVNPGPDYPVCSWPDTPICHEEIE